MGCLVCLKGLTLDVTARKRSADQQNLLIMHSIVTSKASWRGVAVIASGMRQSGLIRSTNSSKP